MKLPIMLDVVTTTDLNTLDRILKSKDSDKKAQRIIYATSLNLDAPLTFNGCRLKKHFW